MAFNEFRLNLINAYTAKNNVDSNRLFIKLGFERTGTIYLPKDDEQLEAYRKYKIND